MENRVLLLNELGVMAIIKTVIPVAGFRTRLLPATKSQPKEMRPIGRKPIVQYVVEEIAKAGLENILFVTGRKNRSIEGHFDFALNLTVKILIPIFPPIFHIFYIQQANQRGWRRNIL